MLSRTSLLSLVLVSGLAASACGGDDGGGGLDDFLPPIPTPTGDGQSVFAGTVTSAAELLPGEAASGLVGDFFIRNSKASFIIQSPARVIGVVPQGGNLVDAVALGSDGKPLADDSFGELSMIYQLGRTCEHQSVEVVQDGSGGGVAAIVARGVAATNDFINIKGFGVLPFAADLDPDIPDGVECATTYILAPDSDHIEVFWTLYNPGETPINGPFATLSDTGGNVESWAPTRGFERAGVEAITNGGGPQPIEYDVFQGPDVAYGLMPIHQDPALRNSAYLVAGVSLVLFGAEEFLTVLRPDGAYVHLDPQGGFTAHLDLSVGRDAAAVEGTYRDLTGEATATISGTVTMGSGAPAAGARVGIFSDDNGDGQVSPGDLVRAYADVVADGSFTARVKQGKYVLRADLFERSRSASLAVDASADKSGVSIELPDTVDFDFTVVDDETGAPLPSRLVVIGSNPAEPDQRLHSLYDRVSNMVTMAYAIHGTTVDIGDGADARLSVPAGGTYRVYASHGTEWSIATADLAPTAGDPVGDLELRLRHVVDSAGYVSSEYHVHSIG